MIATTWTMRLARMLGDELATVAHTQACEQVASDIDGGIGDAAVAAIAALPPEPRRDLEGRELGSVRGDLIPYLTVRSKYDKETRRPGQRHAGTWSKIASMLTTHTVLSHKDHALGFVPVTMADAPCTCRGKDCPGELGHLRAENVLAFNLLMLDLDKFRADDRQLDQAGAERAMARLRELGLRHFVYSTFNHRLPDHASLRAGADLSRPVTVEEWPLFFPAVTSWLDIEHDAKCSATVGRFWFLPAHPPGAEPIAYVVNGEPIDVDAIMERARAADAAKPRPESPRPRRSYTPRGDEFDIRAAMATTYPDVRTEAGSGDIAAEWHIGGARCPNAAAHTSSNGKSDTTVCLLADGRWGFSCLHSHCEDLDHDDFRRHIQPGWEPYDPSKPKRSDRDPPARVTRDRDPDPAADEPMPDPPNNAPDAEPATDETAAEIPPDEHPNNPAGEPFARDHHGKIVQTSSRNIKLALRKLGVNVRHDMFADQELIDGLPGFGPYLDDAAVTRLRVLIHERFEGFRPDKDWFYDVISDCAQDGRFHPVCDYLDSLRWDRKERLDGWLTVYGCAEDTPYTRAVGRLVLIAAVRRVRQPGCKFDEMPILESEQGKNKSTALRVLAVNEDWFSDDLPLSGDTKKAMETTAGKWIVEAGELKGMSKSDVSTLKSYMSRQVDEARMSYGRKRKRAPRQFVIIGTTNETAGYLKDGTGNRRFWPVRVRQFDIAALRTDRDQLWAEAAHRESQGESIRLDPGLYGAAAAEQEGREQEDSIEVILDRHFGEITGKIATEEAWAVLGIANRVPNQDETTRFGQAMRRLGWERKKLRLDGERGYFYLRGSGEERQRLLGVAGFGRGAKVMDKDQADHEHAAQEAAMIGTDPSPRPPVPAVPVDPKSTTPTTLTPNDALPIYFPQSKEGREGH